MVLGSVLAGNYIFWWIAQIVAIVILVAIVLRWRPGFLGGRTIKTAMTGALDAREATIRHQLEAAERSRQEAARIQQESQQSIVQAREEAEQIVTRAQTTSSAIQEEMHQRAQQEYERIVGQAKDEIGYERRQAEIALRKRAADIVIDAAGQVVSQNLNADADRRIIDESLTTLADGR